MRRVAVADTHCCERDLGPLPAGDVFVHAGDLLRVGSADELKVVAEWLRKLPFRWKVVVAGNSDWCFVRDPETVRRILGDHVIYLQDEGVTIEGLRVWGSPWQPDYKDGAFNLPRGAALAEKWKLVPTATDLLVTHGPPLGFGDLTPVGRIGCKDLVIAVRSVRPALHVFGHARADGGVWRESGMCLANVTTWAGRRGPTVLDLDQVSRTVTDVSIPPHSGDPL